MSKLSTILLITLISFFLFNISSVKANEHDYEDAENTKEIMTEQDIADENETKDEPEKNNEEKTGDDSSTIEDTKRSEMEFESDTEIEENDAEEKNADDLEEDRGIEEESRDEDEVTQDQQDTSIGTFSVEDEGTELEEEDQSEVMSIPSIEEKGYLEEGDEHETVIDLKNMLVELDYGGMNINEIYGSYTAQRVGQFQGDFGLPINEITDEETWQKLEEVVETPYREGQVDERVIEFKKKLTWLGYGGMNINDIFGSFTAQRVSQFQSDNGLNSHGVGDQETIDKLEEVLRTTFRVGSRHDSVIEFKEKITALGFGGMNINNHYGSFTAQRVSELQDHYGLNEVTGEADVATLEKVDEVLDSPFQEGRHHEGTIELKEKLTLLGFGNMNINTNYGSFTAQRVSQFQEYYGLAVNGIADEPTLQKIDEILDTPFRVGQTDEAVIELKNKLTWLGYGGMNINDIYGSFTAQRVSEFQSDHGLRSHGIGDQETRDKLDEVLKNAFQEGSRHDSVIEFKEKITELGFGGMNINNHYGSFTAQRVSELQEYYGLEATGEADVSTLAKVDEVLDSPFQEGRHHEDTVELKEKLTLLGFGNMNINTNYGSFTAQRVSQLQEYYGLVVNGIADEPTLQKIDEILDTPLREGQTDEAVIEFKKKLAWLGYNGMNINDIYGSFTAQRVSEFQSDHGLRANGIGDQKTLDKLDEVLSSVFQEGSRHESVELFKQRIAQLGFNGMNINSIYGSYTAQRVGELQAYYGLEVTGKGDTATLEKIDEILFSPFQEGRQHEDTVELKENLTILGFGNMNINETYGSFTAQRVRDLQDYYGLVVNGIVDPPTMQYINDLLDTPFQEGRYHEDTIELKEKLTRLGFGNMNINGTYGSFTAQRVSQLQDYYGLIANGIADEPTLKKINEILDTPFQEGEEHPQVIQLKKDLTSLGYGGMNINEIYGSFTAQRVREFQSDHGLKAHGIADPFTLAKIDELLSANIITQYNLTLTEAVDIQMRLDDPAPQTDKRYAYVSATYVNDEGEVTARNTLNVRSGPSASSKRVGSLSNGTQVNILSEVDGWYQIDYSGAGWVDAARSDVRYYMDPSNFLDDEKQQFQFLDLGRNSAASADLLNDYLVDRGILDGMGQSFIDAGNIHGVNDVYLLSHALLETGHGSSPLANGIDVGKNQSGDLVLVTANNRSSLTDIRTTYNMYGIGAVDGNAYQGGAFRAYNEGWYTPEAAIIDGARFIGNNYVKAGQNTLYKMRWNPASMDENGYASHQYATDIGWAYKQVNTMYNLYQSLNIYDVYLDIPEYLK